MSEPAKPAADKPTGGGGSHPPSPGFVLGMLCAVGIGLYVASFGLDAIGLSINRNTRALFIAVIIGGIVIAAKK